MAHPGTSSRNCLSTAAAARPAASAAAKSARWCSAPARPATVRVVKPEADAMSFERKPPTWPPPPRGVPPPPDARTASWCGWLEALALLHVVCGLAWPLLVEIGRAHV